MNFQDRRSYRVEDKKQVGNIGADIRRILKDQIMAGQEIHRLVFIRQIWRKRILIWKMQEIQKTMGKCAGHVF